MTTVPTYLGIQRAGAMALISGARRRLQNSNCEWLFCLRFILWWKGPCPYDDPQAQTLDMINNGSGWDGGKKETYGHFDLMK